MKRFTETTKWGDPWFQDLAPKLKLAWLYVLDTCDHAGIYDPNPKLMSFVIGEPIDPAEFLAAAGDRIQVVAGKWWVRKFILFQYGPELSERNTAHRGVLAKLRALGLECPVQVQGSPFEAPSKALPSPCQGAQDKDKDKDKDLIVLDGGVADPGITAEMIYAAYPRKEARQDALVAIRKAMKIKPADQLLAAALAYAKATAKWPREDRRFIPHPATWFNRGSYDDEPATWARNNPKAATTEEEYAKGW